MVLEYIKGSNIFKHFLCLLWLVIPHAQHEWGKVVVVGVHIYIYYIIIGIICFVDKKLNRTLAINSSFQTFAVEFLVEFID